MNRYVPLNGVYVSYLCSEVEVRVENIEKAKLSNNFYLLLYILLIIILLLFISVIIEYLFFLLLYLLLIILSSQMEGYDASYPDQLKKQLSTLVGGSPPAPLKVSLEDLLLCEERGRWWIVGSAFTGGSKQVRFFQYF